MARYKQQPFSHQHSFNFEFGYLVVYMSVCLYICTSFGVLECGVRGARHPWTQSVMER